MSCYIDGNVEGTIFGDEGNVGEPTIGYNLSKVADTPIIFKDFPVLEEKSMVAVLSIFQDEELEVCVGAISHCSEN